MCFVIWLAPLLHPFRIFRPKLIYIIMYMIYLAPWIRAQELCESRAGARMAVLGLSLIHI